MSKTWMASQFEQVLGLGLVVGCLSSLSLSGATLETVPSALAAFTTLTNDLTEAPLVDWTFEEGINGQIPNLIRDYSSHNRHATRIIGKPVFAFDTNAWGNFSLYLPPGEVFGSGFGIPDEPALALRNQFTLEASFQPGVANLGASRILIQRNSSALARWSYGLSYMGDTRRVQFWVADRDNNQSVLETAFPQDQRQHHLGAVYDYGYMQLYIDGVLAASSRTHVTPSDQPLAQLTVGANDQGGFWFNGWIGQIRIWDRAIRPDQFFIAQREFDEDGIRRAWRNHYFGANAEQDPRSTAIADPDGDGASNYREYLDNTNPLDAQSVKRGPYWLSTFAGSTQGYQDGYRLDAKFSYPPSIQIDPVGRYWIAEAHVEWWQIAYEGQRIRRIDTNGMVTTVAGSSQPGLVEGPGLQARFRGPLRIVFDKRGIAYATDIVNHRVRRIDLDGVVSTFAGSTEGYRDGFRDQAQFKQVTGLAIDGAENFYVAEWGNNRLRKINSLGMVSTVAQVSKPTGLGIAPDGTVYVASYGDGRIYRLSPSGSLQPFGPQISSMDTLVVDASGGIYVSTPVPKPSLYRIKPDGVVDWVVSFDPGWADGPIESARVAHIDYATFTPEGDILFADGLNHNIRRLHLGIAPLLSITAETNQLPTRVVISSMVTNGIIRFTLDGSNPTTNSAIYGLPVLFTNGISVKAQVFVNNYPVTEVQSKDFGFSIPSGLRVVRHLPAWFQPGSAFTVQLETEALPGVLVYAVEDQIPAGWIATNINHNGSFDAENQKVKFGPFFDSQPRSFGYEVVAPASWTGSARFQGQVASENLTSPILGNQEITTLLFHPADRDPADWRLVLGEVTRYSGAWKQGQTWMSPPNPIPITYMTRAVFLWKGGETYRLDANNSVLPQGWINAPAESAWVPQKLVYAAATGEAVSEMPSRYTPGQPVQITVQVTPAPGAQNYAAEEILPEGWTAANINEDGVFDSANRIIRWGPFFDAQPRTLRYEATAPLNSTHQALFAGVVSWDGALETIVGTRKILPSAAWQLRVQSGLSGSSKEGFVFEIEGPIGGILQIEISQDLISWFPIAQVTNVTGKIEYRDPSSSMRGTSFYRLIAK